MKIKPASAFSMVEVIVAAVVFTLAVVGILASMGRARMPVTQSDQRLKAASLASNILGGLRSGLSSDSWDTSIFSEADNPHEFTNIPGYPGYNATYNIVVDDIGGKKLDLTVSW